MQPAIPHDPVLVLNPEGRSRVVVVCEHASRFIPPVFDRLGLDDAALKSHIAWDPGAVDVAHGLAKCLNAKLITSNVSRLVFDCNRPPYAHDAIPVRSEKINVPGNVNLTAAQRDNRTISYYDPFRTCLAAVIAATPDPIIITVHSFTPIYHGTPRTVEIGILHDSDDRLANAMKQIGTSYTNLKVAINDPYGPEDGVTHTLKEHAIKSGHLNVMLEIRNDLIADANHQDAMAECLAKWLSAALAILDVTEGVKC
ncbi:putative N-formylglutamate amidohydrolase [Octadecabacter antarcticus 307]|uniref:Putative N-formylglutamate amidohydrolase n=1 Tax=Octadecabacter antarcticus 307 TaxID=391626 RepID=M9RE56_9RHOB|nr:N-formylglutamate amidohydrolase [Octadecabacter antarcticus]AGI68090.1 putative N-formylglutamate amidohydrolase [Octadecabacter antarcticus 307]